MRIVQRNVGQMSCKQRIDTATGTHQKHLGVDDAGAQRAGKDASQIDHSDACGAVHHFQWNAKEQLYDDVEAQMEPIGVQEHVAEETPDLQATIGSIDEHRIAGNGHGLAEVLGGHGVAVVGEDCNLQGGEREGELVMY